MRPSPHAQVPRCTPVPSQRASHFASMPVPPAVHLTPAAQPSSLPKPAKKKRTVPRARLCIAHAKGNHNTLHALAPSAATRFPSSILDCSPTLPPQLVPTPPWSPTRGPTCKGLTSMATTRCAIVAWVRLCGLAHVHAMRGTTDWRGTRLSLKAWISRV